MSGETIGEVPEVPKRSRKTLMAILLIVIVGVACVSVFIGYYLTLMKLIPSDYSKLKEDYPELTKQDLGGDVDYDFDVDYDDFIALAGRYGCDFYDDLYEPFLDLNSDGKIDYDDFIILAGNYGKTTVIVGHSFFHNH